MEKDGNGNLVEKRNIGEIRKQRVIEKLRKQLRKIWKE